MKKFLLLSCWLWAACIQCLCGAEFDPDTKYKISCSKYPGSVLVPGSTGQSVITLQKAINSIAETDSNVPTVQVTGYFGQELQEAVSYLQMIYGFPVTGRSNIS